MGIVVVVVILVVIVVMLVELVLFSRFLRDLRRWENKILRRRQIEDVLQKKYPHVLVLPAWNVFPVTGCISYTVAENPDETPEQVAARIVAEVESKRAREGITAAEDLC